MTNPETPTPSASSVHAAKDKLLSARACGAKLAMDAVQDEDARLEARLLGAVVLNGLDAAVVDAVADSYKGFDL